MKPCAHAGMCVNDDRPPFASPPVLLTLDRPELWLQWEQGIFMWSAVTALGRYRCEDRYGQMETTKDSFNEF